MWNNEIAEQRNKNSKDAYVHSMQAMPLYLDRSYIRRLDHVDTVLSYGFLLARIH